VTSCCSPFCRVTEHIRVAVKKPHRELRMSWSTRAPPCEVSQRPQRREGCPEGKCQWDRLSPRNHCAACGLIACGINECFSGPSKVQDAWSNSGRRKTGAHPRPVVSTCRRDLRGKKRADAVGVSKPRGRRARRRQSAAPSLSAGAHEGQPAAYPHSRSAAHVRVAPYSAWRVTRVCARSARALVHSSHR
jgi:hypothetical protein